MTNIFEKQPNQLYLVDISKKGNDFYFYVDNCIIYDSVQRKHITNITDANKSQKINATLNSVDSKFYVYLECDINQSFQITSASIKGSSVFLPSIEGSDGAEGFTQSKVRALLALIGQGGRKSMSRPFIEDVSNKDCSITNYTFIGTGYSIIRTFFALANGSPIVYLGITSTIE